VRFWSRARQLVVLALGVAAIGLWFVRLHRLWKGWYSLTGYREWPPERRRAFLRDVRVNMALFLVICLLMAFLMHWADMNR
jgi:hypothetical protein